MRLFAVLLTLLVSRSTAFTHGLPPSHIVRTATGNAFSPTKIPSSHVSRLAMKGDSSSFSDRLKSAKKTIENLLSDFDLSSISQNVGDIQTNIMEGELGQRGESYVFVQFGLLLSIVFLADMPLISGIVYLIAGPTLFAVGLMTILLSLSTLGDSLSPWPVPASVGELKTDGIYGIVRHPMYSGLLASCFGLSILTSSVTRIFLTTVLLYVLEMKSDIEEEELNSKYPDYRLYQKQVPGKFFPLTKD